MNELLPIIRRQRRPLVVENVELPKAEPVKPEDGGQKAEDGTKTPLPEESQSLLTSAATETTTPDANVTPKRNPR